MLYYLGPHSRVKSHKPDQLVNLITLRIVDIHGGKITKNQTPTGTFCSIILPPDRLSKICMILFYQVARDAKNVSTFEKCPLVAELKLKMSQIEQFFMFLISALPPEGAFKMFTHFSIWPTGQKNIIQFFERRSGCKLIEQTVPGGSNFQWFSQNVCLLYLRLFYLFSWQRTECTEVAKN